MANDGFAVAHDINKEKQRQAEIRKNQPMEFRMSVGEGADKGVSVVVLDVVKYPAMPFFHYMHRWGYTKGVKGSMKSDICIKDGPEGCPLCKKDGVKDSTYELVLTVLDGRSYTPQNGPNAGKTVRLSKKLFIVKSGMIPKYERLFKEHKSFRGMVLTLFRDKDTDPASGGEVKFGSILPEAVLMKKYGSVHGADMIKPVDYNKAYPRPTYNELAERWGEGSHNETHVGGSDFGGDDDGDSVPF